MISVLLGASCILLSGTCWGFLQSIAYKNRPQQIRMFINALQRLQTEIEYGMSPLIQALKQTADATAIPLSNLFLHTAQAMDEERLETKKAWEEAIDLHWSQLDLKKMEKEVVLQFAATLGISDRIDQKKHIQLRIQQLQLIEEEAKQEQLKYEKMWRWMGVMGAMFIVLLLL